MIAGRNPFSRSVTVPARTARSARRGIPFVVLVLGIAGSCDLGSVLLPEAARPFEPPPGGHFVAKVTATNPSPFPVLIEGMTGEIATQGFGFDLRGPDGGNAEWIPPYVGVGDHSLFWTFNDARYEPLEVSIRP